MTTNNYDLDPIANGRLTEEEQARLETFEDLSNEYSPEDETQSIID